MVNSEGKLHTPLLAQSHTPWALRRACSRTWITVMVMAMQLFLCCLVWVFSGRMVLERAILLPDNSARWIRANPNETNILVTVTSTALGLIGSFLLGITVQHALTSRLSRGVRLSTVTAWIQLAGNSLFFQPRRHLWWTLLSVSWVGLIHFLTTAWSNLLTPGMVIQQFPVSGLEPDLLSPATADSLRELEQLPPIYPRARNYSLIPQSDLDRFLPESTNILSQAGIAGVLSALNKASGFMNLFYSSKGGVLPLIDETIPQGSYSIQFPVLDENHNGFLSTYTFVRQGHTANVTCVMSSSPSIALNNTALMERMLGTPSRSINQAIHTWSWRTNCSGNGDYYTGEVDIIPNNHTYSGELVATSVCFYQDFSGPSNQSFLFLVQLGNDSLIPRGQVVCQVTPIVTTVKVEYNENKTMSANHVQSSTPLPNDSWPFVLFPGFQIWLAFSLAQGPHSNSLMSDIFLTWESVARSVDFMTVFELYIQGVMEYLGIIERLLMVLNRPSPDLQSHLPKNGTIPFSGTMDIQTMGWRFHLRTHGISLAAITLVTILTMASGVYALVETSRQKVVRDPLKRNVEVLDPNNLMDVLALASTGSLASALSQCAVEEDRENLRVELAMTDEGQFVLNVC